MNEERELDVDQLGSDGSDTDRDDALVLPVVALPGGQYPGGDRHICVGLRPSAPSIQTEQADDDWCDRCERVTAQFWVTRPQPYRCEPGCGRESEAIWIHLVCYVCLQGPELPNLWDQYLLPRMHTDVDHVGLTDAA